MTEVQKFQEIVRSIDDHECNKFCQVKIRRQNGKDKDNNKRKNYEKRQIDDNQIKRYKVIYRIADFDEIVIF